MTQLRVGAVQMTSVPGERTKNLSQAEALVRECAGAGARLVLLPELFSSGYLLCSEAWRSAEPLEQGPTMRWARNLAQELQIYLGGTLMEHCTADEAGRRVEDVYNTFFLLDPSGKLLGSVRKAVPSSFEAFLFKKPTEAPGKHVIDTPLGRIGVGICYENALSFLPHELAAHGAQLLLMPHACPVPVRSPLFPESACASLVQTMRVLPGEYAKNLNIPVVFCNHSGPWHTPLVNVPFLHQHSVFSGCTCIVAAGGKVSHSVAAEENVVVVSDILLQPRAPDSSSLNSDFLALGNTSERDQGVCVPRADKFVPWTRYTSYLKFVFGLVEALGEFVYHWYPFAWRAAFIRQGLSE